MQNPGKIPKYFHADENIANQNKFSDARECNTRFKNNFVFPKHKTAFIQNNFPHTAVLINNTYPAFLKTSTTLRKKTVSTP